VTGRRPGPSEPAVEYTPADRLDALHAVATAARSVVFDARGVARDWPIGATGHPDTDEELVALEVLKAALRRLAKIDRYLGIESP
jgi:hypothetical protein